MDGSIDGWMGGWMGALFDIAFWMRSTRDFEVQTNFLTKLDRIGSKVHTADMMQGFVSVQKMGFPYRAPQRTASPGMVKKKKKKKEKKKKKVSMTEKRKKREKKAHFVDCFEKDDTSAQMTDR